MLRVSAVYLVQIGLIELQHRSIRMLKLNLQITYIEIYQHIDFEVFCLQKHFQYESRMFADVQIDRNIMFD